MVFYLVVYTVVLKLFAVAIQRGGKCEPTRAQCTPRFGTNLSHSLPTVCCFSIPTKYAAFPGFLLVRDVCKYHTPKDLRLRTGRKPRPIKNAGGVGKFAKPGNGNRPIVTRRQFLILKNFHLILFTTFVVITLSQVEA